MAVIDDGAWGQFFQRHLLNYSVRVSVWRLHPWSNELCVSIGMAQWGGDEPAVDGLESFAKIADYSVPVQAHIGRKLQITDSEYPVKPDHSFTIWRKGELFTVKARLPDGSFGATLETVASPKSVAR